MDITRESKDKHAIFFNTADAWITAAVGVITIGGALGKGVQALFKKKKENKERKDQEDEEREKTHLLLASLPDFIDSMKIVAAQQNTLAESVSSVAKTVARLENNQIEIRELRRIQADQDDIAYYRCRPDGRCYEVSPALCEIFGLTEAEMLLNDGGGWVSSLEKPTDVWNTWMNSIHNNLPYEDIYTVINKARKPHTSKKYVAKAWPLRGTDGTLHSFYGEVKPYNED